MLAKVLVQMMSMNTSDIVLKLKPSTSGFLKRYLLSFTPLILLQAAEATRMQLLTVVPQVPLFLANTLTLLFLVAALIVSWVLRSPEATASTMLSLLLPVALPIFFKGVSTLEEVVVGYSSWLSTSAIVASLLTMLAVEVGRRSISYEVTESGVLLKAGVWRRQEQSIPYNSIGRIVLEQSVLGRILNYGTIILVSPAEWGAEYYTRSLEARASKMGLSMGLGYARTLKEVSRDPSKCLYGVKDPKRVRGEIEARIHAVYRAELDQARYLKDLRDKIVGG